MTAYFSYFPNTYVGEGVNQDEEITDDISGQTADDPDLDEDIPF